VEGKSNQEPTFGMEDRKTKNKQRNRPSLGTGRDDFLLPHGGSWVGAPHAQTDAEGRPKEILRKRVAEDQRTMSDTNHRKDRQVKHNCFWTRRPTEKPGWGGGPKSSSVHRVRSPVPGARGRGQTFPLRQFPHFRREGQNPEPHFAPSAEHVLGIWETVHQWGGAGCLQEPATLILSSSSPSQL